MRRNMPHIYLLDISEEMTRLFRRRFSGVEGVEVVQADFATFMDAHAQNMRLAWDQIQEHLKHPFVATFGSARQPIHG